MLIHEDAKQVVEKKMDELLNKVMDRCLKVNAERQLAGRERSRGNMKHEEQT